MIRVLVAEDSAATRELLVSLLGTAPGFAVAGVAADGAEAVAQVERLRPDVVLMDIHMPRLDGLEATRKIMATIPTPIVLVSASFSHGDAALSCEAIRVGALTVLEKPAGPRHPDHARSVRELLDTVRLMSGVKVVRRWPPRELPALALPRSPRRIRLVAIGASTGGPAALAELLGGLNGATEAPILVVQHTTPGFAAGLVEWLSGETRLAVKLAEASEMARPGTVYVGPHGGHLGVGPDGRLRLDPGVPADAFCPSVSRLFESVAQSFGTSALGVLLTGMGRDGVEGLGRLRSAGGVTVAQDEASSVIFGMPGEAIRAGAVEHVLPPKEIARLVRSLTAGGR